MEFFVLYLLTVLENFKNVLIVLAIIQGFIAFLASVFHLSEGDSIPRYAKVLMFTLGLTAFMIAAIPSKKEMAVIAAGGITYNVVTSPAAKEIGGKGVQLLIKKLDEMLEDEAPAPEKK